MTDDIQSQARICPICLDDHSSGRPCKPDLSEHFVPRWGLARFPDEENDDPHPWLFTDAELIAIRVILSVYMRQHDQVDFDNSRQVDNCFAHIGTAIEKLKLILNAELEK